MTLTLLVLLWFTAWVVSRVAPSPPKPQLYADILIVVLWVVAVLLYLGLLHRA